MSFRPQDLPLHAYNRLGAKLVVPFAVITILACVLLFRVGISPRVYLGLPSDDPYIRTRDELSAYFAPSSFVLISLNTETTDAATAVESLDRLSTALAALEGVHSVVSPATVRDIIVDGDGLRYTSVLGEGGRPLESLHDR